MQKGFEFRLAVLKEARASSASISSMLEREELKRKVDVKTGASLCTALQETPLPPTLALHNPTLEATSFLAHNREWALRV